MTPRFSLISRTIKVVFDLDDTLYVERDYVHSALSFAGELIEQIFKVEDASKKLRSGYSRGAPDPIGALWDSEALPVQARSEVVAAMRAHIPEISLRPGAEQVLQFLRNNKMGFAIITDGRSVTQRAKMAALGCLDADFVSISGEVQIPKTDVARFKQVESRFPCYSYCYIGDNPAKDFVAPNRLGWQTIMLADDGNNIHPQDNIIDPGNAAKVKIGKISELIGMML
jgi:putative hydrolase of the HAD superfamily